VIYGIGIDVVEPHRVARLLDRYGTRFARRVLTSLEWPGFERTVRPVLFIANRFSAKEAFSKAMGTGFRYPVTLQCISVVQNRAGKPGLAFHPALERLVKERGIVNHHLTISDESSIACACVVLET
jgi:holo-[acyl-carrier protein] synthase